MYLHVLYSEIRDAQNNFLEENVWFLAAIEQVPQNYLDYMIVSLY
jgi:hypothetical protein